MKELKPRAHRLSDKDRRRAKILSDEVHQRQEELAAIMERYLKKKIKAVFEPPGPLDARANSITIPGFTFFLSKSGVAGMYDHGSGV